MGQIMTLLELLSKLDTFDPNHTIYAIKPWSCSSIAIIINESPNDDLNKDTFESKFEYFLEIFIALEFLSDWSSLFKDEPCPQQKCKRLIDYATNDA